MDLARAMTIFAGDKGATMELRLNKEEAEALRVILLAELEEKRVELHHARNIDYKTGLQAREKLIQSLLAKMNDKPQGA